MVRIDFGSRMHLGGDHEQWSIKRSDSFTWKFVSVAPRRDGTIVVVDANGNFKVFPGVISALRAAAMGFK